MKVIKLLFVALILVATTNGNAQIKIGNRFDINGTPFDNYFDPLLYNPENKLEFIHYSSSYELGKYCDNKGQIHKGLIKFENDKIWFKTSEKDLKSKVHAESISYLTIGTDSFIKIHNYYFRDKLRPNADLVQYLTNVDGKTFVKRYHFTSAMAQGYGFADPIIESYLYKENGDDKWKEIPKDRSFDDLEFTLFPSKGNSLVELLVGKIKYTEKNIFQFIKYQEYHNKYRNKKPIYFDKYWNDVATKNHATYHANITNLQDSIWSLEYFKDSVKLYDIQYSSFYPHIKNGKCVCYYPDGTVRKTISYIDNKAQETIAYDSLGQVIDAYHYEYFEEKSLNGFIRKYTDLIYDNHNPQKDDIFTNVYHKQKVKKSYRLQKTDTVFQLSLNDLNLRMKSLQSRLKGVTSEVDYQKAISEDAQGYMLLTVRITPKGNLISKELHNSLHPDFEKVIFSFVQDAFMSDYGVIMKPYKRNRKKYYYEITIPIEFKTVGFYRRPNNSMQQMQMMQQMNQMNRMNQMNIRPGF